jgi:hypothetical protein
MVLKRALVALTPLAGALAFPVLVPLLMTRVSIPVSLLAAVLVLMLRTSEMPSHH